MSGLSDGDLDRIEAEARERLRDWQDDAPLELRNTGLLLAEVAALVGEVRRLRSVHEDDVSRLMAAGAAVGRLEDGIRDHRDRCASGDAESVCGREHDYGQCGESDAVLWGLLDPHRRVREAVEHVATADQEEPT